MRKVTIIFLVALFVFVSCGGGDDEPEVTGVTPTNPSVLEAPQDEFLIVDGGDPITIEESCVDTSGQYTANLPDGGIFILRGGNGPDESFVDYLPSEGADPLSSQDAEDTITAAEGSFVTGSTTVYTEDGANSLEIEFGITIEDVEQGC